MSGVTATHDKSCVVLQPGYLPWLGYFAQICHADVFVHLDDVQFDRHGWRNRNRIKGPNGPQWLTVPVRISGQEKPRINEVLIDPTRTNWAAKHLKTIEINYSACPFFRWLYDDLRDVLASSWTHIAQLDIALVDLLCQKLGLVCQFRRSSQMTLPEDRCDRLVAVCRQLGCNHYYAGAASRAYMDLSVFDDAGIDVSFQDYHHPTYPQRYAGFESHLSVIDLMFHRGPDSLAVIKSDPQTEPVPISSEACEHARAR